MDGWQAAQNWLIFGAVIAGAVYYYYPQGSKAKTARPASQVANKAPSTSNKASNAKRSGPNAPQGTSPSPQEKSSKSAAPAAKVVSVPIQKKGTRRRPELAPRFSNDVVEEPEEKAVDDSTRAFAQSMIKARQGIDVKKTQTTADRVKTVKPKNAATSSFAAAPSDTDFDDGDWSQVTPAQTKASGVEDMLEAPAPGPSSLRITPSQKPTKEKAVKQPKQEVAETKKQRQNRQKVEQQRTQREEDEKERKALEERQRRAAREARGEPAKNGLASAPAPKNSAWTAPSSQPAQATVDVASQPTHLLDTFDAESTSSSNDAQVSTAATSTTDGAAGQWSDEPFQPEDLTKSMVETGPWNEVKKKQKNKKTTGNQDTNGSVTPVASSNTASNGSAKPSHAVPSLRPTGFAALTDELDPNDASNW